MRHLLIRHRISLVLKVFATFLLFSVVWVFNPELPEGEVAGQWHWLAQTGILYSIFILFAVFFYPGPRKHPTEYYYIIIWSLIAITAVEAVWGIVQFILSTPISGSFHNDRLYAGYLAVIFPVCLNEWLSARKENPTFFRNVKYYSSLAVLILIIIAAIITMLYPSWFALIISSLFVMWYQLEWKEKVKYLWHKKQKKVITFSIIGLLAIAFITGIFFTTHNEETQKQVFLTKIAFKAISEHPLTGHGSKTFLYAYGKTQENYFADNTCSEEEKLLADYPLNASNEYLHGAIEWGIPIVLGMLVFVLLSIHQGVKNNRIGVSAGVLSLLIFSFFANPMLIPAFTITAIFLLFACIMGRERIWLVGMAIVIGLFGIHWWRTNDYYASMEWARHQRLFHVAAYQSAHKGYDKLYSKLSHKPAFLYEHAFCLHKLGKYDESIKLLEEAAAKSNDPMIHDVMGRNYQLKGNYKEAESCYLKSTNMVPNRMLPYYFLAKLYNEPDFKNPSRCKEMAQLVLEKQKDNQTSVARQMREEAMALLREL